MGKPLTRTNLQEIKVNEKTVVRWDLKLQEKEILTADVYANGLSLYWRSSIIYSEYIAALTDIHRACWALLGAKPAQNNFVVFHPVIGSSKVWVEKFHDLEYPLTDDLSDYVMRRSGQITFCSFTNPSFHFWGEIDGPLSPGKTIGLGTKVDIIGALPELLEETFSEAQTDYYRSHLDNTELITIVRNLFMGEFGKGTHELS